MLYHSQMKLLVSLAQADGHVADRERNYIINIGRANGIYPDEIAPLFNQKHKSIVPKNLTSDDKFDCIFSLVQLMKIDERMYREEIVFCAQIATRLGYDQQVMFDLMLYVRSAAMNPAEIESLKKLTETHLLK
jgi:uncharacterized membrane protein YebE (DUF533 family)